MASLLLERAPCLLPPVTHASMMHPQPFYLPAKFVWFWFSPKSMRSVLALIRLKHSSLDLPPFTGTGLPCSLPAGLSKIHLSLPRSFRDSLQGTTCLSVYYQSIYQMKAHYLSNGLWPMGLLLVVREEGIVTYCLFPAARFH